VSKIKSTYDLEQMRVAGRVAAEIIEALGKLVQPGVSAAKLDEEAAKLCERHGVEPAFLGYQGFPNSICISVNDEVVHGIPYASKVFAEGDLVKLDFGVKYRGYYSDHCRTFGVGKLTPVHQKLLAVGEAATLNAVKLVKTGNRIGDVSHEEQATAEAAGFSVVRTYIGHGIGKKLHEEPEVPAFGEPGTGPHLQENMVICVECQVCEKGYEIIHERDGWTSRTKDGGYVVMFEHMVRVTDDGPEVLTMVGK
jgi:methionyl aminopeptidase